MTREEDQEAIRRGYWLRRARDAAHVTLADAAQTAGLGANSGSSVSLWERGKRPIKVVQMKRLAVRYGVPVSLFTDPPMTDDERLAAAISEATRLERDDAGEEGGGRRRGDGGRDEPPSRRLA